MSGVSSTSPLTRHGFSGQVVGLQDKMNCRISFPNLASISYYKLVINQIDDYLSWHGAFPCRFEKITTFPFQPVQDARSNLNCMTAFFYLLVINVLSHCKDMRYSPEQRFVHMVTGYHQDINGLQPQSCCDVSHGHS